ncbi:MAG: hypothetical protein ABII26_04180 [Pseudomonadota bacterium]
MDRKNVIKSVCQNALFMCDYTRDQILERSFQNFIPHPIPSAEYRIHLLKRIEGKPDQDLPVSYRASVRYRWGQRMT